LNLSEVPLSELKRELKKRGSEILFFEKEPLDRDKVLETIRNVLHFYDASEVQIAMTKEVVSITPVHSSNNPYDHIKDCVPKREKREITVIFFTDKPV